jgi:RimJ/RimL family protein N-acetyltransferase
MLDYGFTGLCLHHIRLSTLSFNERGIRAYTRAGFRTSGRWRQAHRFGGQAYDVILMDCLATEFQSPVLRRFVASEGSSLL